MLFVPTALIHSRGKTTPSSSVSASPALSPSPSNIIIHHHETAVNYNNLADATPTTTTAGYSTPTIISIPGKDEQGIRRRSREEEGEEYLERSSSPKVVHSLSSTSRTAAPVAGGKGVVVGLVGPAEDLVESDMDMDMAGAMVDAMVREWEVCLEHHLVD